MVKVGPTTDLFKQKLLDINVWAMTLILALVLEQASGSIVTTVSARNVDTQAWAALGVMALVFGMLLGTTVGILALHVLFAAPYRYWYVVVDMVFITVPLFIAMKFIAASLIGTPTTQLRLDDNPFRIGATMIALSFVSLSIRDGIVLPQIPIPYRLKRLPLIAVTLLHLLGALLFFSLAVLPGFVVYVAVTATLGLAFFFAGMFAIPAIEAWSGIVRQPVPGDVATRT